MPENVIVTLLCQGKEADFKLPAKVPLRAFEESLKKTLRLQFSGVKIQGMRLLLRNKDGYLASDHTLEEYGIFDGAILEAELVVPTQQNGGI